MLISIPTPTLTIPMAWSLAGLTSFRTPHHRIHSWYTPQCTENNHRRSYICGRTLYTWKPNMRCLAIEAIHQTAHPGWHRLHSLHHHSQHLGQNSQNAQPLEDSANSFALAASMKCSSGFTNWNTCSIVMDSGRRGVSFEIGCMEADHF